MLLKLALHASTCYNNRNRGRGFNRDSRWRPLQGGSKPVIFDDIYKSGFLPALRSLDLNCTFFWANGGGCFPLCNVKLTLIGLTFHDKNQVYVKIHTLYKQRCITSACIPLSPYFQCVKESFLCKESVLFQYNCFLSNSEL